MKIHVTDNTKLAEGIRKGLLKNDGYCPCVFHSNGKEEYLCPCKNFREEVPVGEACHCGLYIKDEQ